MKRPIAPIPVMSRARCTRFLGLLAVVLPGVVGCVSSATEPHAQGLLGFPAAEVVEGEVESDEHGVGHRLLLWIPNRIFDVFDLVRARVRLGPGWSLSARATELLDVNLGGHGTVWAGLPGPRGRPRIPWPFGLETFSGVEVSVADATQEGDEHGPNYGPLEVGAGLQALILGVDVGVDVFEVLDLLVGIVLFDPAGDDF